MAIELDYIVRTRDILKGRAQGVEGQSYATSKKKTKEKESMGGTKIRDFSRRLPPSRLVVLGDPSKENSTDPEREKGENRENRGGEK